MLKPALVATLFAWTLGGGSAAAEVSQVPPPATEAAPTRSTVVGGEDAALGDWPATAGVVIGGDVLCTGTLVAPTLVLTAGHCRDAQLSRVIIGANKLSRPGDGETITVVNQIREPTGLDAALLVLEREAEATPHPLALGWAAADIRADAPVAIVGFGATNDAGSRYEDTLQQGFTTIIDPTCANRNEGCEAEGRELIAGEGGIDSCFGDSGGPLYLLTDYGTFLAGITSRGINSGSAPCGQGGIYVRADATARWVEEAGQVLLPRPAAPSIDDFEAAAGEATTIPLAANDPQSQDHTFELAVAPLHGTIARSGARLVYTPSAGYLGPDAFVLTLVDATNPDRKAEVAATVTVVQATGGEGCGCQSDGAGDLSGAWLFWVLASWLILRPRR